MGVFRNFLACQIFLSYVSLLYQKDKVMAYLAYGVTTIAESNLLIKDFLFLKIYFLFDLCTSCIFRCSLWSNEDARSAGTGVRYECWKLCQGPLEEQFILGTAEQFLQSKHFICLC